MRAPALVIALALLCGCDRLDDPNALGRYAVEAELTEGCADQGLLAAQPLIKYVVFLRLTSTTTIQWNDQGDIRTLSLAPDDTFEGARQTIVDMRQGQAPALAPEPGVDGTFSDAPAEALPPCSIQRIDRITGTLDRDVTGDVPAFEASIRYEYEPTAGSSCDDLLIAEPPLANELPCAVDYEMTADKL